MVNAFGKSPVRVDVAGAALRVRNSHDAVMEGIATHAEKHRIVLHEKRAKLAADKKLQGMLGNGK